MRQRLAKLHKFLKEYGFWICCMLIVFLLLRNCSRSGEVPPAQPDSARYWKDQYGNAHAKIQDLVLEKAEMKATVDSMAGVLKIKPKQITRYVSANLRVDTIVIARVDTLITVDTVTGEVSKRYPLTYIDSPYIKIKGIVPSNPQTLEIALKANIAFSDYWERKKILGLKVGKKTYYTDIGTDNPYITISNAQAYKLKDQPKLKIKTGFGVGLTFNPQTRQLIPGIQAGIYLIRSR